ncbi:MAG: glycosyltransferase family 39 protein [Planctomycetes bacterium]|nr:glycosyltransferase family 39 protein [Planctomycetota bacterium]
MALLWSTDRVTSSWAVSLRGPTLDPLANDLARLGSVGFALSVVGGLFLAGVVLDRPAWRRLAPRLLGALALTALVVVVLKPTIGRQEAWFHGLPDADAGWIERHWGHFPSTHAALAWCLATFLGCVFPRARRPLFALAVAAAAARVFQGAHLPADVFAGALIGLLVARRAFARAQASGVTSDDAREVASPSPTARALALLVLLAVPLFFFRLGGPGFFDPDEGRYAEIPREMLASGDFVTPTLDGVHYFEKPPLLAWLVAASFRAFGQGELQARVVPALAALLGVLVAYVLGRRMFGRRAGLLGAVILSTSLFWALMARGLVIDMLFSSLLFAALALWWCGHVAERRAASWFAGFWTVMALAVLAKGPVALVLVGGTVGLYALLTRRLAALVRPALLLTLPVLLLVGAPWFVLVSRADPEFDHFFWYQQHVARFLGEEGRGFHEQPFWYLIAFLPLLFFPWSVFVPAAMLDGRRRLLPADGETRRAAVFLLSGAFVVTAFFSASSGKLLPYVLPTLPLVALPLGAWFDEQLARGGAAWTRPLRVGARVAIGGFALFALAALVGGIPALAEIEDRGPGLALLLALPLLATSWVAARALARRDLARLFGTLALGMALTVAAVAEGIHQTSPNHSCRELVRYVLPGLRAGGELVTYDSYLPGLGFYARRRLVVGKDPGELLFGSELLPDDERALWFPEGFDELAASLGRATPTFAVVRDHDVAGRLLARLGPGVHEIVWNKRRSILGNDAALALVPARGRVTCFESFEDYPVP